MLGAKPNGTTVVPLAKLASYSLSDDIVDWLIAFRQPPRPKGRGLWANTLRLSVWITIYVDTGS